MTAALDDDAIAREIVRQCLQRGPAKSICPSEVARALVAEDADWRALMPDIRRVADTLRDEGRIAVMQRGQHVHAATTRGPIRLSLSVDRSALKRAVRALGLRKRRNA